MSKIIKVINTMVSNPEKITNVIEGALSSDELFFIYDSKFKWSISVIDEFDKPNYYLNIYPNTKLDINELAKNNYIINGLESFVSFSTKEFKSQEAIESFRDLYNIVKSKLLGLDEIFNNILNE